jgi:hypothetical protein
MSGKLIDKQVLPPNDVKAFSLGNEYASGVYMIVLMQGDAVKTLRMIKR